MKIKPFRIPKQIVLPGLVIQVREVSNEDLGGCAGDWEYELDTEGQGRAVIRINSVLAMEVKRYTLIHELQHTMVDYLHAAFETHLDIIHPQTFKDCIEAALSKSVKS